MFVVVVPVSIVIIGVVIIILLILILLLKFHMFPIPRKRLDELDMPRNAADNNNRHTDRQIVIFRLNPPRDIVIPTHSHILLPCS